MKRLTSRALLAALTLSLTFSAAAAQTVVINQGDWPIFASSVDQPELSAVLVDPATGQVVRDPVHDVESTFDAFIDTGASGIVISKIQAEGYYYGLEGGMGDILSLSLDEATMSQGDWDEYGIGGTETGWISPLRHIRLANGVPGQQVYDAGTFQQFDLSGGLWVRKNIGAGEVILSSIDPVNIIGMPVIKDTIMVMDPTPLDQDLMLGPRMITHLLSDPTDPGIPATNATIAVTMVDFTAGAGSAGLAAAENPIIPNITLRHDDGTPAELQQDWLFDTGSGSTFLSFTAAQDLGLIGPGFTDLADYMANGSPERTTAVGGIGEGTLTVPILTIDEISVPTEEGMDLAFRDVDVLVLDIEGLDGVFGMNLLVPAMTLTLEDLELGDLLGGMIMSPRNFDAIVFDPQAGELRLASQSIPEPTAMALLALGGLALVRRRRKALR
jgi:hypothetical protein